MSTRMQELAALDGDRMAELAALDEEPPVDRMAELAEAAGENTLAGQFFGAPQNLARGALQSVGGGLAALGAVGEKVTGRRPLAADLAESVLEAAPAQVGTGLAPEIVSALGSSGVFALAAPIGGTLGVAAAGALANGGSEYLTQKARDPEDDAKAWRALLWGGAAGTLEALPIGRQVDRAIGPISRVLGAVNERTGGRVFRALLTDLTREGAEEALTEGAQSAMSEVLARNLSGDELPMLEAALAVLQDDEALVRIGRAAGVGAAAGGVASVLGTAVQQARVQETLRDVRGRRAESEEAQKKPAKAPTGEVGVNTDVQGARELVELAAGAQQARGEAERAQGRQEALQEEQAAATGQEGSPAAPSVAATPEPFLSQEEHDVADLRRQGRSEEYLLGRRESGIYEEEEVTGWQKSFHRVKTAKRAAEHVRRTGQPATYAEIDLRNLGGLNAEFGHQGANRHFRAIADIVRAELEVVAPDAQLFRHGGDEVSAIVVGLESAQVEEALSRAQAIVDEYVAAEGLEALPHTKEGREPGVGIHYGVSEVGPGENPEDFFSRADLRVEGKKKAKGVAVEQGSEDEAAGAVGPGPDGAGDGGRAAPESSGPDRGEGAAGAAPAVEAGPGGAEATARGGGPAQLARREEAELFGIEEREVDEARRAAGRELGGGSAVQPNLIDVQKGDVPGQTSLIDLEDARREQGPVERDRDQEEAEREVRRLEQAIKRHRRKMESRGAMVPPPIRAEQQAHLEKLKRQLDEARTAATPPAAGPDRPPPTGAELEARAGKRAPSVEEQREALKRREAARKAQAARQERYRTSDLRTFVRSLGGLRDKSLAGELRGLNETIGKLPKAPGLWSLVQRRTDRGITVAQAIEASIEAGFFPGGTQGVGAQEVGAREFLAALEADMRHPEALEAAVQTEGQRREETEAARLQAAAEEAGMDVEEFLRFMSRGDPGLEAEARAAGFGDDVDGYLAHLAWLEEGDANPQDPERTPTTWQTIPPADPLKRPRHRYAGRPIGDRLTGNLEAPPEPGKPVSAPEVIQSLARIVAAAGRTVPIRWGRMGQSGARGHFEVQPEVIRVKVANNIATSTHEVGHALEKAVFGWNRGGPWKKPVAGSKMQAELARLGRRLYGNTKPAAGYKREGWAEFVRMWVTRDLVDPRGGGKEFVRTRDDLSGGDADAESLGELAPLTLAWFEQEFLPAHPKVREAFDEARGASDRWREQGSRARAEQSIVPVPSRLERAIDQIKSAATVEAWFEAGDSLRKLSRLAARNTGQELAPEEDPFFLFQAYRMTHDSRVETMATQGMIDLAGNQVGPSLRQALASVEGRMDDFRLYLWAQQSMLYWKHRTKKWGEGRNPGLSQQDARQLLTELDQPGFAQAAVMLMEWHEGVLNYAAQASTTFRRVVDRVRQSHPGYLMPLQREFEQLDSMWIDRQAKGSGGPLQRMKGSGRRIKDPFPVMLSNARALLLKAHQRRVLEEVIRLQSRVEGLGSMVVKVPPSRVPAATVGVERLSKELHRKFGLIPVSQEQLAEGEVDVDEAIDALEELAGETMTFFGDAPPPNGDNPVLPYWNGSKVEYYEVDGSLFRVLSGMDPYRLPGLADLLLGGPARTFRLGTTGLRASFGLVTNPARDFQTLYVNTLSSASAPRLFAEWTHRMILGGLSQVTGKQLDPYREAALRLGVQMSQSLGQDVEHTRRAARQLFQGRTARILDPRNSLDFFRELFNFPELASRTVEFKAVADQVGWKPGQPMTESQAIQMLLASKQVSTDFTAAGSLSRAINQMVPFHNAALQGPRAHFRAYRRKPWKFMLRGAQLSVATLLLWWLHKDEEWYEEMPYRERFAYWHFPVTLPSGERTLVRIPRAFEIGATFGALPEAFADAVYRQDPAVMGEWMGHLATTVTPPVVPVLPKEAFEQALNKDLYWKTPIVPEGERRLPAEEQFSEYTSRIAIFLGEMFGVSPRRIEHAVGGIAGGVGRDLLHVIEPPGVRGREAEAADAIILGRLFQRGGELGFRPRSISKLYDALEEAQIRQFSRRHDETEPERQARLLLSDAARAVTELTKLRGQLDGVDERRALTKEAVDLAREAIEAADRVRRGEFYADEDKRIPTRAQFQRARREAERRLEVEESRE